MIRSSQQAAYGLGYLASLTHTGNKPRDVDYALQAQQDFARYARMNETQLAAEIDVIKARQRRAARCKATIQRLLTEQPGLSKKDIARRLNCSEDYVYRVAKGAR